MATWIFEPGHTEAEFRARHMMVSWVRGLFKDIHGRLELDWDRCLDATFEGEIDAAGIWTGQPQRDEHLRSADFFDVENHPKITFSGRFSDRTGATTFKGEVDLTIRGVTREGSRSTSVIWASGRRRSGSATRTRGSLRRIGFEAEARVRPPRLRRLVAGRRPRRRRRRLQRNRAGP